MFYAGQKVICVDAEFTQRSGATVLRKGAIYTVAGVVIHNHQHEDRPELSGKGLGLHLIERPRRSGIPFSALRFRPVVERKTDISIFTDLLNKISETVS
jgi:hypothetical protein